MYILHAYVMAQAGDAGCGEGNFEGQRGGAGSRRPPLLELCLA